MISRGPKGPLFSREEGKDIYVVIFACDCYLCSPSDIQLYALCGDCYDLYISQEIIFFLKFLGRKWGIYIGKKILKERKRKWKLLRIGKRRLKFVANAIANVQEIAFAKTAKTR